MPIMKGKVHMKILKIENKCGMFLTSENEYEMIEEITKEDIYYILNYIMENTEIELDEIDESNIISNPASKLIYEKLRLKFNGFYNNKVYIQQDLDDKFRQYDNLLVYDEN